MADDVEAGVNPGEGYDSKGNGNKASSSKSSDTSGYQGTGGPEGDGPPDSGGNQSQGSNHDSEGGGGISGRNNGDMGNFAGKAADDAGVGAPTGNQRSGNGTGLSDDTLGNLLGGFNHGEMSINLPDHVQSHSVQTSHVSNQGVSNTPIGHDFDSISNSSYKSGIGFDDDTSQFHGGENNATWGGDTTGIGLTQAEIDNINTMTSLNSSYPSLSMNEIAQGLFTEMGSVATLDALVGQATIANENMVTALQNGLSIGQAATLTAHHQLGIDATIGVGSIEDRYKDMAKVAGIMEVSAALDPKTISLMAMAKVSGLNTITQEIHAPITDNAGTTLQNMIAEVASTIEAKKMGWNPTNYNMLTEIDQDITLDNMLSKLGGYSFQSGDTASQIAAAMQAHASLGVTVTNINVVGLEIGVANAFIGSLPVEERARATALAQENLKSFINGMPQGWQDALTAARLDDVQEIAVIDGIFNEAVAQGVAPQFGVVYGAKHDGIFSKIDDLSRLTTGLPAIGFHTDPTTLGLVHTDGGFMSPAEFDAMMDQAIDDSTTESVTPSTYQSNISSIESTLGTLQAEQAARSNGAHLGVGDVARSLGLDESAHDALRQGGAMDFVDMTDAELAGMINHLAEYVVLNQTLWIAELSATLEGTNQEKFDQAFALVQVEVARSAHYQAVEDMYMRIMGRSASDAEKTEWADKLRAEEVTLDAMRTTLAHSDETSHVIDLFYQSYLGREAEQTGKAFWLDELAQGKATIFQVQGKFAALHAEFATVNEVFVDVFGGVGDKESIEHYAGKIEDGTMTVEEVRAEIEVLHEATEAVQEMYTDILGNTGDVTGIKFWQAQVEQGHMTLDEVRDQFMELKELNDVIDAEFLRFFGRQADDAGLTFWRDKILSNEMTINEMRLEFAGHIEHSQYVVEKLYADIFRKSVDDASRDDYANKIQSGDMTIAQVRAELLSFKALVEELDAVYADVLGHEGDMGGLTFWMNQIHSGRMTMEQVRDNFERLQDSIDGVKDIYNDVLKSEGDDAGIQFWASQIYDGKMSLHAVRVEFVKVRAEIADSIVDLYKNYLNLDLTGAELSNLTQRVLDHQVTLATIETNLRVARDASVDTNIRALYEDVLDQAVDQDGLAFWKSKIISGQMTLEQVSDQFEQVAEQRELAEQAAARESQEAAQRETRTTQTIAGYYQTYLGHAADQGGMDFWKGKVLSGEMTITQVQDQFEALQTQQLAAAEDAELTLTINGYYANILHQTADQDGVDFWKSQVDDGKMTLQQVQQAFLDVAAAELAAQQAREDAANRDTHDDARAEQRAAQEAAARAAERAAEAAERAAEAAERAAQRAAQEAAARAAAEAHERLETQVEGYYTTVLGQTPDQAGVDFWVGKIESGKMTAAQVRTEFVELKTIQTQVVAAYKESLNRDPTATEKSSWSNKINDGKSTVAQLKTTLDATVEHDTLVVRSYYATILKQAPDQAGVNFWVGKLQSGAMTDAQVRSSFVTLDHNQKLVIEAYTESLGRQPSTTEKNSWTDKLGSGQITISQLRATLDDTLEHDTLVVRGYYTSILGQAADTGGVTFWVGKLQSKAMTEAQVRAEFVETRDAYAAVKGFYKDILGISNPDKAGMDFWAGQIKDDKMTVAQVRAEFVKVRESQATPLVVDMDGDGVELISQEHGVKFDIGADGRLDNTAWVGADDALLAIDKNNNGVIDDHSELFGTLTTDGFSVLAELDSNKDNVIDAKDDDWGKLRFWKDVNSDGVTQDGELLYVKDEDIISIDLNAVQTDDYQNGSWISHESTITRADGTQGEIVDAWFNYTDSEIYAEGGEGVAVFQKISAQVEDVIGAMKAIEVTVTEFIDADACAVTDAIQDFTQSRSSGKETIVSGAAVPVESDAIPIFIKVPDLPQGGDIVEVL